MLRIVAVSQLCLLILASGCHHTPRAAPPAVDAAPDAPDVREADAPATAPDLAPDAPRDASPADRVATDASSVDAVARDSAPDTAASTCGYTGPPCPAGAVCLMARYYRGDLTAHCAPIPAACRPEAGAAATCSACIAGMLCNGAYGCDYPASGVVIKCGI